jgi:hypothetical protein
MIVRIWTSANLHLGAEQDLTEGALFVFRIHLSRIVFIFAPQLSLSSAHSIFGKDSLRGDDQPTRLVFAFEHNPYVVVTSARDLSGCPM